MRNATQPPSPSRRAEAAFGQIDKSARRIDLPVPGDSGPDFRSIARSAEFLELRGTLRRFTFPMTLVFVVWYVGYVVLAAYFPDLMGIRLFGAVNIGLALGIGQFISTLVITALYLRFAAKEIDPRVAELYRNATGEERP